MRIVPSLGWLALALFTVTAAQADGSDLGRGKGDTGTAATPVTPKTKAPGVVFATARRAESPLVLVGTHKPRGDYEAEIYSGVPLDGDLAKGRGLDKGLVNVVFAKRRQATFRVGAAHIKRRLRLVDDRSSKALERWDLLDTDDGLVVVATTTSNAGIFTTSDVYAFARGATLGQRLAAVDALPLPARGRIREVMNLAERSW